MQPWVRIRAGEDAPSPACTLLTPPSPNARRTPQHIDQRSPSITLTASLYSSDRSIRRDDLTTLRAYKVRETLFLSGLSKKSRFLYPSTR